MRRNLELMRFPLALLVLIGAASPSRAQQGCCGQSYPGAELQIGNAETSVAFYHDALGMDYSPAWTGKPNPFSSVQGKLTGMSGQLRTATMVIPGADFHIQLVESTGIDRKPVMARRQDIGATGFILYVRNLDAGIAALKKANAPIVSAGGKPVNIADKNGKGRAILAQDPDGYFVELRQIDPLPATTAPASSNVIGARMSLSVADTGKSTRYWSDLLNFDVTSEPFGKNPAALALNGTPHAQIRKSIAKIRPGGRFAHPGPNVVFELQEFKGIDRKALNPRYQDPGAGGFVLRFKTFDPSVRGKEIEEYAKLLRDAGMPKILTAGNGPEDQMFRFAMFTQDLNGFIMEVTQSIGVPRDQPGGRGE